MDLVWNLKEMKNSFDIEFMDFHSTKSTDTSDNSNPFANTKSFLKYYLGVSPDPGGSRFV